MARFRPRTMRARFGLRVFLLSTVFLGIALVGTGLFWRARLMNDKLQGLTNHIDSIESELETLYQAGAFPSSDGTLLEFPAPEQGVQVLSPTGEELAGSSRLTNVAPAIPPETISPDETTPPTTIVHHPVFGHSLVVAESFPLGPDRYVVEAITGLSDLDRANRTAFVILPIAALLLSLVLGTAVGISVDRALRPVRQLARRATAIAAGRRAMRLDVTADTAELQDLAARLDDLLSAIRAAFDREQIFLDDASHDLRTPIAIARAELELAQRHTRHPDTAAALRSAIEELDRVDSTAAELLVLARARAAGTEGFTTVDVGDVAQRAAANARRDPNQRRVNLAVMGSGEIEGDAAALERALTNLVTNAVRHCAGKVEVSVRSEGHWVTVVVADDGPGFPDHLLENLFDRFTRGTDRRAHGTGLGTAIAAEIVATHNGTIHAANSPGGGAAVTIRLPASPVAATVGGHETGGSPPA
jgi:two-component system, OmpR family, sensor kinase